MASVMRRSIKLAGNPWIYTVMAYQPGTFLLRKPLSGQKTTEKQTFSLHRIHVFVQTQQELQTVTEAQASARSDHLKI